MSRVSSSHGSAPRCLPRRGYECPVPNLVLVVVVLRSPVLPVIPVYLPVLLPLSGQEGADVLSGIARNPHQMDSRKNNPSANSWWLYDCVFERTITGVVTLIVFELAPLLPADYMPTADSNTSVACQPANRPYRQIAYISGNEAGQDGREKRIRCHIELISTRAH